VYSSEVTSSNVYRPHKRVSLESPPTTPSMARNSTGASHPCQLPPRPDTPR
jgi:hypothetical protein